MNRNSDHDKQKELTRRELLKKAGKLAYTAPTLMLITLQASADEPNPPPDPPCWPPPTCPS